MNITFTPDRTVGERHATSLIGRPSQALRVPRSGFTQWVPGRPLPGLRGAARRHRRARLFPAHIIGASARLKSASSAFRPPPNPDPRVAAYLVHGHRRLVLASAPALSLVVELILVDVQVLRGTTGHFNLATPLDAGIFSTMGAMAVEPLNALSATRWRAIMHVIAGGCA